MRDWKALARARGLAIPAADLDRLTAPLDSLGETFRPLAERLTPGMEPSITFRLSEDEE